MSSTASLAAIDPSRWDEALRTAADPHGGLDALIDHLERSLLEDLAAALDRSATLVAVADAHGSPAQGCRARRARAQALAYSGRFEDALDLLDAAVQAAVDGGEAIEHGRARATRLHALAKLGRLDEAVAEGRAARAILAGAGRPDLAARADINLGVTLRMAGRPTEGLEHLDRARSVLRAEPAMLAPIESNRAEALLDASRFAEAEAAFRAAFESFEAQGAGMASAIVEGNLADLMSRQGRFDEALEWFERARRRLREAQAEGELARLEAEQAEAFASAGLLEEARRVYEPAIETLARLGQTWDAARARLGLAAVLIDLDQAELASSLLASARETFARLTHERGLARTDLLQARAVAMAGDAVAAAERYAALRLQLEPGTVEAAEATLGEARSCIDAGRRSEAEASTEAAIEAADQLGMETLCIDALHERGRLRLASSRREAGLRDLREAAGRLERARRRFGHERLRRAYATRRSSVNATLFAALLDDGGDASAAREAFTVADAMRNRALLDVMQRAVGATSAATMVAANPETADLLRDMTEEQRALLALHSRLDELKPGSTGPSIRELLRQMREREERMEVLEARLGSLPAARPLDPGAGLAGVDELEAALGPATALIQYAWAGSELVAFIVGRGEFTLVRGLIEMDSLEELVDGWRLQLSRISARLAAAGAVGEMSAAEEAALTDDALHALRELSGALWRRLEPTVGEVEHLVFVPAHGLDGLPFAALPGAEAQPLSARCSVTMAPSAAAFLHLSRMNGAAPGRDIAALVVGAADEAAPQVAAELERVRAALPNATVLAGDDATRERFLALAARARHVHFAGHARFLAANPNASGLRLADGWLTPRDLLGLRLDGASVILSGCETGGLSGRGSEAIGLPRAFLMCGARAVLSTLWPLHDKTAADTLDVLYGNWNDSVSTLRPLLQTALREAQEQARHRRPHPFFWAMFSCTEGTSA